MNKIIDTRRKLIKKLAGLALSATLLSGLFNSCKQIKKSANDPCNDFSDLSEGEMASREQLGYVAQSSFSDRTCSNCQLFVKSDKTISCGGCLAMKGPVANGGYCTVWAPVEID